MSSKAICGIQYQQVTTLAAIQDAIAQFRASPRTAANGRLVIYTLEPGTRPTIDGVEWKPFKLRPDIIAIETAVKEIGE